MGFLKLVVIKLHTAVSFSTTKLMVYYSYKLTSLSSAGNVNRKTVPFGLYPKNRNFPAMSINNGHAKAQDAKPRPSMTVHHFIGGINKTCQKILSLLGPEFRSVICNIYNNLFVFLVVEMVMVEPVGLYFIALSQY